MKHFSGYAIILIGFSFTFLIINKITFGISVGLGILILLVTNKILIKKELKKFIKQTKTLDFYLICFFLMSFFFSSINSITVNRSFSVLIYLILFFIFSLLTYLVFYKNKINLELLFKTLSVSILFNSVLIFTYNISNYNSSELVMFKGYMNIISLITVLNLYFIKSKLNLISSILLIPNIFMTGSASSFLGLLIATIFCIFYFLFQKYVRSSFYKNSIMFISFSIIIILTNIFINNLPSRFDKDYMTNFEYKIPLNIVDAHRQIIWGFAFDKFKDKPFFGYGPDSSNFIEGSQEDIGIKFTGDMNFIPSHPHNFFFELLLETGLVGTTLFILFLIFINFKILNLNDSLNFRIFIIFFNAYFWGASLVNFSFWLGWWQGSYYLLLSLLASKGFQKNDSEI